MTSYQSYETDKAKQGTPKYYSLCNRLDRYDTYNLSNQEILCEDSFNTSVIAGERLFSFYQNVSTFEKRDCFKDLDRFINEPHKGFTTVEC